MREEQLLEIANFAVEKAIKFGASEAEAFVSYSISKNVNVERNEIKLATRKEGMGIGIRVLLGKKLGFAHTNSLDKNDVIRIVEDAISIAKANKEDPNWKQLPSPKPYSTIEGTYNKELIEIELDQIVNDIKDSLEKIKEFKAELYVNGAKVINSSVITIVNSHGIEVTDRGTYTASHAWCIAKSQQNVSPICNEVELSRVKETSFESVMKKACEKAISCLKVEKINVSKIDVVFTPFALEAIVPYTLYQALNGERVYRKRSPYAGRLGEKVASEKLTIIDDGILAYGFMTRKMDDEGVPTQRKILIERGILRNFLYDNYYARLVGKESTGNGFRPGGATSLPTISPTNFMIKEGDYSNIEIIQETKFGLLVDGLQGAHSSNPETGEFSVVATPAWIIQNGELKATKGVMLAGNFYELLNKIEAIGKETRQVGSLITAYVKFSQVRIVQGP